MGRGRLGKRIFNERADDGVNRRFANNFRYDSSRSHVAVRQQNAAET